MEIATVNDIRFYIYQGISSTRRKDPRNDLARASLSQFTTTWPRGLYVGLSLFIPRVSSSSAWWSGGDRLVVRNGAAVVWEGRITNTGYAVNEGDEGVSISAIGMYGDLLGRRTLDKRWADNRLSGDVWVIDTTNSTAYDLATLDRLNRLHIIPKQVRWPYQFVYGLTYTMPTGQTIKRAVMDFAHDRAGYVTADFAKWNNAPAGSDTYTDMTNSLDGDDSTFTNLTLTSDDYIYIGTRELLGVALFRFDMGTTVNANAATMTCEYFAAPDDTTAAAWTSLSITDGTASGGATLAQDGNMTFTLPDDMQRTTVDSNSAYWFRLQASADLTASIDIIQISLGDILSWRLRLRDRTGAADIWSTSITTSGSRDDTLGTPRQSLALEYISDAVQIPRSDASYYGEISGVMMYSETDSAITAGVIAADVLAEAGDVNSYTGLITDPALTLEPFYTDGPESLASILERAVSFGDSSFNSYYARLVNSELAESPDGKPVMELAQYPALTDYDYAVSLNEENLDGNIQFVRDFENIINYVTVQYRDDQNNRDIVLTPDDDSALKDSNSITLYGERHVDQPLNIGVGTSALALGIGKRYLAANKNPKFYVSSPIRVTGYIRGKQGNQIPACEIQAGKRLKIENYLDDLAGTSGAGLTQIITDTTYTENDNGEFCSMNLEGVPDNLAIILAQRGAGFFRDNPSKR